jgi:hypothetical protein
MLNTFLVVIVQWSSFYYYNLPNFKMAFIYSKFLKPAKKVPASFNRFRGDGIFGVKPKRKSVDTAGGHCADPFRGGGGHSINIDTTDSFVTWAQQLPRTFNAESMVDAFSGAGVTDYPDFFARSLFNVLDYINPVD